MAEKVSDGDPTLPAIQRIIETLGETTIIQATPAEIDEDNEHRDRPSMESSRPGWLRQAIDSEFSGIAEATKEYGYHGTSGDYSFGSTSALRLIANYRLHHRNDDPLRVLDVGTGAGAFLTMNNWPPDDVVHGISGFDYRTRPNIGFLSGTVRLCAPSKDDPRYLVGNAEYLDEMDGLLPQYDVIVSKRAMQHLVDILGTLEAIANRVAPGGMLCLHAGRRNHKRAVSLLLQNGFIPLDASGLPTDDPDEGAVLIRTDARPIRFNLEYEQRGPEYKTELQHSQEWPLTQHEINTLSWQYVEPD
jgi:SAM-dependent methyltransferase